MAASKALASVVLLAAALFTWRTLRRQLRISLLGRAIVVTGCDSGLGWAIVKRLAAEKALVFAACLSKDGMERCKALEGNVIPVRVNITRDEDVSQLVSTVKKELTLRNIQLTGLVNNAGIGNYGFAECLDLKRFQQVLDVNCLGTVRVTKALLPLLRAHGPGARLVTMGSLSDRLPAGFGSAYVPTKAYACWFAESVGAEVRRFGVRSSVIEPGFIATELLEAAQKGGAAASSDVSEELRGVYGDFAPMMKELRKAVEFFEWINGGKDGGGAWVADRTVDALSSLWPRSRYLVGWETTLLMWLPRIPGWTRLIALGFEQQHRNVHK